MPQLQDDERRFREVYSEWQKKGRDVSAASLATELRSNKRRIEYFMRRLAAIPKVATKRSKAAPKSAAKAPAKRPEAAPAKSVAQLPDQNEKTEGEKKHA